MGLERRLTSRKKRQLLTIPKSSVSYLFVANWLRYWVKCEDNKNQSAPYLKWLNNLYVLLNISWVGGRFTLRKKRLLLTIPKSGVSYLYVKNWLRYAFLKLAQFSLPILYLAFWVFAWKYFCCMMKKPLDILKLKLNIYKWPILREKMGPWLFISDHPNLVKFAFVFGLIKKNTL